MADDIDIASVAQDKITEDAIKSIRANSEIKKGVAGDCEYCGYFFSRLINGSCGGCRDTYKIS